MSKRSERELIAKVREVFGALASEAVDDDASTLPRTPDDHTRVVCTDQVIEGTHFLPRHKKSGGWRAVVRNISDLAAVGAKPVGFMWSLTLPDDDEEALTRFCEGAADAAREYGMPLLGGDLAKGPKLACTVTALGDVRGAPIPRGGAQVGDKLFVSRPLGLAARGLEKILAGGEDPEDPEVLACLYPEPELRLGQALVGVASACIDVSDGVGIDLHRMCEASGIGADITLDLPDKTGEDYALLFAAPNGFKDSALTRAGPENSALTHAAHESILEIGHITAELGIRGVNIEGWDHFG